MIKFIVSTLLMLAVCSKALEITLPEEVNVEIGTTATITCSYATEEAAVTMKWYKKAAGGTRERLMVIGSDGANIDGGYQGRPISAGDDGSLIIEDVTAEDDKAFKDIYCVVEAGTGSDQTESEKGTTFTVIVYPATDPVVSLDSDVFEMGENKLIGTCRSGEGHPKPTITFLKNGEIVKTEQDDLSDLTDGIQGGDGLSADPKELDPFAEFTNDDIATVASDGFSLVMKTSLVAPLTAEDDNAVFTCVAEVNGETTQTDFAPIRVNYPTSVVTVTASSNPANEGDEVTFTCSANGYPDATITSFGEGDSASYSITATKADNGRSITCYASNSGNIDPVASDVFVLSVNYNDVPEVSEGATLALGAEFSPTCTAVATAPGTTVAWSKDGEAVTFPITASFASAGTYTCTSTAPGLEATSADVAVEVNGLTLEEATGAEGEDKSYSISCTASAVPKASFTWSVTDKDGVTSDLIDGITASEDGISLTSTLLLNKVDSKLSLAHIKCTATNGVDEASKTYDMPEIATGGAAGIVIGILIGLLVLAIVLYVLYSRGIICKDNEKEGVEDGNKDIEVGGGEPAAPAEQATEEEKAPLTNGDGAKE